MSPAGKVCPVCDTQVQDGVKKCPSCGTDLTLFEVELDLSSDNLTSFANAVIGEEKKSLDDIISSITSSDAPKPVEQKEAEKFACPSCGTLLAIDATQCHSCGVEFTEDVVEQFECPVCNSIVEGAANKCPSCGAEFATEEEAPPEEVLPTPATTPAAPPQKTEDAVEPQAEQPTEEAPPIEMKDVIVEEKSPEAPPQPVVEPVGSRETVVDELAEEETKEEPPAELSFMDRMRLIREKRVKEETEMKAGPTPSKPAASPTPRIREGSAAGTKPAPAQQPTPRIKTTAASPPQSAAPPEAVASQQAVPTRAAIKTPAKDGPRPSLTVLVKDMKPLLQMARDLDVDIAKERAAIDQAIKAAKSKDQESAVDLLIDAKASVESALLTRLSAKLDQLQAEAEQAKSNGLDVARVDAAIRDARLRIETGDPVAAKAAADLVAQGLSGNVKETLDANEAMKSATELAARAKGFGMNVDEALQTLKLAQGFLGTGDVHKGAAYAKRAKEMLTNAIPDMVKEEMRKAKGDLLSAKMLGKDIARPMAIMKNASLALKSENYEEALRSIQQFKESMKML